MVIAFCYVYTFHFFQSWFHTYLVKAHGYREKDLLLSSLPFLVAVLANFSAGLASNALVKKLGLKWGRRSIGVVGLGIAAAGAVAVMLPINGSGHWCCSPSHTAELSFSSQSCLSCVWIRW